MKQLFIGIDLGGTNIKVGCFDSVLNLISNNSVPTGADKGPEFVVDNICQAVEDVLSKANAGIDDIAAVGVGAAAILDLKEGVIKGSPNMPLLSNMPLRKMLSDRFAKPVVLENDANTACWGEYVLGAGRGIKDMVFFTLGTGVGGGVICNGSMVHGCDGSAAELGHIMIYPDGRLCGCGQKGCLEAYASANATVKRTLEEIDNGAQSSLKNLDQITCKDIYDHAAEGDELAKKITDETAKALAIACISVLHVTSPQRIVFAGGMIGAGDFLLNRIKHFFGEYIWEMKAETVEICFAALGQNAGIIGAAGLAKNLQENSQ